MADCHPIFSTTGGPHKCFWICATLSQAFTHQPFLRSVNTSSPSTTHAVAYVDKSNLADTIWCTAPEFANSPFVTGSLVVCGLVGPQFRPIYILGVDAGSSCCCCCCCCCASVVWMCLFFCIVFFSFLTCSSTIHCGQHTRCCEGRQAGSLARKHTMDQIARQAGNTKAGCANSQTDQQLREARRQPGRNTGEPAGE